MKICIKYKCALIIKPTRSTNLSNLFLEQDSTCFGQFLCPSSGFQCCTHSNILIMIPLTSSQHNLYNLHPLLCVQRQTPDDGQRNCPKHVESYSKNKFEKLVLLVGFIITLYHDARSSECQIYKCAFDWNIDDVVQLTHIDFFVVVFSQYSYMYCMLVIS